MLESLQTLGSLVAVGLCLLAVFHSRRLRRHFVRRWESVDKRLSEVLWRTRHSDAEELRKRAGILEERTTEIASNLRLLTDAVDSQLEMMREEFKTALSQIGRTDAKNLGQSRMIIFQLERLRSQLLKLEANPPPAAPAPQHGDSSPGPAKGPLDGGYRMEAVLEPIRRHLRETEQQKETMESLLRELTWDDAAPQK